MSTPVDDPTASPKQWGKDWWWRQDGRGEMCSKDYVRKWIGSQICPSKNPDCGMKIDYKPLQPIEGLVQCVRDLSDTDCSFCLQNLMTYIPNCCENNQGGLFYTSSCFLRFELYPFLQIQSQTFSPPPQPNVVPSPRAETSPPPQSNVVPSPGNGKGKSTKVVTIVVPLLIGLLLFAISAYLTHWLLRRNKRKKHPEINVVDEDDIGNEQSLHFNFDTIKMATNDFSDANKLGEGGFGAVYKGEFLNGQEIAVKRLSKHSGQGSKEFKNEVLLLHKLQHRNLVRLLGFCLSGEEQLLIYEYLPNTSLDKYIFDQTKKALLNWEMRYKIIEGIARGLLYLHEDSRLRIIHRDLKAANILLDEEMNAKIADFGLAKLFGVDQSQGNTRRIAGTLGYMAPEYALHGLFSVKSDVFSFGVLLLEIVSGRKCNDYYASDPSWNLLNH
ncbi:Cysteine-rich receptor-like protein kinase, partial [Thalictrum thalictroides]